MVDIDAIESAADRWSAAPTFKEANAIAARLCDAIPALAAEVRRLREREEAPLDGATWWAVVPPEGKPTMAYRHRSAAEHFAGECKGATVRPLRVPVDPPAIAKGDDQ